MSSHFININLDTAAENPKSLKQEHCQNVGVLSAPDKQYKSMPIKPRPHHCVTFLQSVNRNNEYHLGDLILGQLLPVLGTEPC